jgi:dienelactone hydrolase
MSKRGWTVLLIVLSLLPGAIVLAQETKDFADYKEMRAYLGELFQQKKYAEAAALLESVLDRYPANVLANTFNLAAARAYLGEADKAVDALEEGLRRGVFFGLWDFVGEFWDPIRETPRFRAFLEANKARVDEASGKAVLLTDVVTPEGYDPARKYPLFIALHGGGETMAELEPLWTSPRLKSEFITLYVQSTQVASMKGFHWQDAAQTRRDVEAAYKKALARYPIDTGRVLIGGFSSGGYGAMVTAFANPFPVRGFVALCPSVPEALNDDDILAAKGRGLRGTVLTTELDHRVEAQRALAERMAKLGLTVEFHQTPNIGHWFPEDFAARLDRAIGLILADAPAEKR